MNLHLAASWDIGMHPKRINLYHEVFDMGFPQKVEYVPIFYGL